MCIACALPRVTKCHDGRGQGDDIEVGKFKSNTWESSTSHDTLDPGIQLGDFICPRGKIDLKRQFGKFIFSLVAPYNLSNDFLGSQKGIAAA